MAYQRRGDIVMELGSLFVHPDFQRQGLGTVLFNKAVERAKSLNVRNCNGFRDPGAEQFYEKIRLRQSRTVVTRVGQSGENVVLPQHEYNQKLIRSRHHRVQSRLAQFNKETMAL